MNIINKKIKSIILGAMTISIIVCNSIPTLACSAIYVGSKVSDDGTIIVGRSNDNQDVWGNYVTVVDRVENVSGRKMPVDKDGTVMAPIPATTFKYTATPWMDSTLAYNGLQRDAACCTNEYGVTMTMSITAFTNDKALKADPEPVNGLTEFAADDLVICQSKTARRAVSVLTGLIDRYGSSESNIAIIADQNEAWYVEMYTGHEYAAVKLPDDKVCVFGNEYNLEYLSDYETSIVSKNLLSLPKKNGFAVYGKNHEMNLKKTYAAETTNYCHMRTWIGHKELAPSEYGDYKIDDTYQLAFTPKKKVSLQDAMAIMRNRFEGTKYSPDETGRYDMRVIGTDTALSVHILQIYPDLPAEMSCVTWESTGPAIYGTFVPVSNYETAINSSYGLNQPAKDVRKYESDIYPYYTFKELNTLCLEDVNVYGAPVREYWNKAETNMIKAMKKALYDTANKQKKGQMTSAEGAKYITDFCSSKQENAFKDAKQILNEVRWSQSKNSNTMKLGRNPKTHEFLDEMRKLDPIKLSEDANVYK